MSNRVDDDGFDFASAAYATDARNGRFFGPFAPGDELTYCHKLNQYLLPEVLRQLGTATGPFFPVAWPRIPPHAQAELVRLYHS